MSSTGCKHPLLRTRQQFCRSTLAAAIAYAVPGVMSLATFGLTAPDVFATEVEAVRAFHIAPGPLTEVLNRFGEEAGILLSFSTDITDGQNSPGVNGRFSVSTALNKLLVGTGTQAMPQEGGFVLRSSDGKAADEVASAGATPEPKNLKLEPLVITAAQPTLYGTPDVNAGALGVREMKDLPFSVGSYTTDTIENQRARTALDVLKNDPSVTPVTYGASFDGVAVRGFSANTFNNVRRDGLLANVYADVPLENKERVDVLKGVSGFLYGVGDPSGLVNYVVKRPTRDPLLSLTGEVRNHDGFYTSVDAGGPLADGKLGYRFNVAREKVGNFTHPGDLEREFVGGAMDFKINPQTLLQLDFDYQEKEQAANANLGLRSDGSLVPASSIDPRQLIGQSWGRYKSRSWNVGARLDYELNDDWVLTSQLGYGTTKRNAFFNNLNEIAENGDVLRGGVSYEGEDYNVWSGQMFATGRFDTGNFGHEVVTGYSYWKMEYPEGPYLRLPDIVGNIYHPISTPKPYLPSDTGLPTAYSTQNSVFASDTIALTEQWSVLLGARYIEYLNDKPRDFPDSGVHLRYETNETVPAVSIMYKPASHTTIYATYTKGFEQGAYAPGWADNAYQRLDPITSRQYELGIKSNVLDGLLLSAALFDIDKPLQTVSSIDNMFKTQGRQHHRGLELAANGQLTSQLSGILGASWLDAEQTGTDDPDANGKRPANVAKFQANAFLDYSLNAVPGLSLNTGYYYVGERPINGTNSVMVDSFGRWDAGAAYTTRLFENPTIFRLTVENVADKRYWESVVYNTVGLGDSRTVRLSLTTQL
jgi:iron complex outermembrane receptor protein